MVRTGARAAVLEQALVAAGFEPTPAPERPRVTDLPQALQDELKDLFHRLGGTPELPSLKPGSWDLSFDHQLVVELDEELHFNRYRALSLAASWARSLPWTTEYQVFCERHEADCTSSGSWGKRWTNPSCERMFGLGARPGDLAEPGAPRWKQRALYDALKDTAPDIGQLRFARISVYDLIGGVPVEQIVQGAKAVEPHLLRSFIESRTAAPSA